MTYSCSDFTDDIFEELTRVEAITAAEAQDPELEDNPGLQGTYALNAVARLVEARDALAQYQATVVDFMARHGLPLNDGQLCAADDRASRALVALSLEPVKAD